MSGPATTNTVQSAGTVFSRRSATFFVSYWFLVRAPLAPDQPRSPLSSRSRSPSPSAKQTVRLRSRVTLMSAFVMSCSESLVIFSLFVPFSTMRMGQGPRTS